MIAGSALFGAAAAASWGVGDFAARFMGRAAGVPQALFGVMLVSSVGIGLWVLASGTTLVLEPSGLWLLALNGIASLLATLLLFEALTHGPVSLASPIASSNPALAVPISVVFGARPEPIHWAAMAATLGGVWLVAMAVSRVEGGDKPEYAPAVLRRSVLMAIGSAVCFAVALLAADHAVERHGLPLTLLSARIVGAFILGASFLIVRKVPRMRLRAWPLILLVALADTLAFVLVYVGLSLENGEFAIVTSAAYSVVAILLARIILREPVAPLQWLGVAIVIGGIGTLSVTG